MKANKSHAIQFSTPHTGGIGLKPSNFRVSLIRLTLDKEASILKFDVMTPRAGTIVIRDGKNMGISDL